MLARREEMGAEVKPEVCILGGGDVRRWWGGRGGCVAFWVELVVWDLGYEAR